MTYDQILTLDYIVKYGSFKAASEAMFKSQPSLSMAIKKLEEEYQIKIFDRTNYRPELTEEGKKFYKKAQLVISEFLSLDTLAKELGAGFETEIKICADAVFPICHISSVLKNFFEPHITTTLDLNIDVLEGVIEKLQNHVVDFALGPDLNLNSEIEKVKILEVKVVPVISPEHFNKMNNDINYLKTIPQIIVGSSSKESRGIIRGLISNQYWNTSDLSMKEQLITNGLGWGRLPLHQIEDKINSNKLVQIKNILEVDERSVSMYLLRSKTKIMGPNTKSLWNFLKTKFAQE